MIKHIREKERMDTGLLAIRSFFIFLSICRWLLFTLLPSNKNTRKPDTFLPVSSLRANAPICFPRSTIHSAILRLLRPVKLIEQLHQRPLLDAGYV